MLTDQDKALINDLINICWSAGAVKSPKMGMMLEQLRAKVTSPPEEKPKKKDTTGDSK